MNDSGGAAILRRGMIASPLRSVLISSPSSTAVGVGVDGGGSYILHTVSKFDTLAGVAIKYGVEVSDIKKLNGLVTDLQMFARKTLHIPLTGRHPPSPSLPNGGTPPRPSNTPQSLSSRRQPNLFDSFPSLKLKASLEQKLCPEMKTLQGYYGLRPSDLIGAPEGFEMAVYRKEENGYAAESSPISVPSQSQIQQRKSKRTDDLLASENGNPMDQVFRQEFESRESDKSVRRRQKSEADFSSNTFEKALKDENSINVGILSITGKGLAPRPKSCSRTVAGVVDGEAGIAIGLGDSFYTNDVNGVDKTSGLLDLENGALSSIWQTSKLSLKPDFLQAFSSVSIGLAKPTIRRNKASLD